MRSQNLIQWDRRFENTPCFILATGPSLEDHDLSLLADFLTIGINRVCCVFDPVILMWQDRFLFTSARRHILNSKAIKLCRDTADRENRFNHFFLWGDDFAMSEKTSILHGWGSTGPLAFQLAYLMGCNPIILLGMDGKYNHNKTNFWGNNAAHPPDALPTFVRGLQWIKSYECKRDIFNCSANDVFDTRTSLEHAIKISGAKPLGQSFFKSQLA